MSDENISCSLPSTEEPTATRSVAPMWIIVVTLTLLFLGFVFFDRNGGWFSAKVYAPYFSTEQLESFQPQSGAAAAAAQGKKVYESVCGICHGTDGLGKPGQAPPLASSDMVNGAGINRLIHIPLAGLNGPIQVSGKDWNLAMAPMGAALPDDSLAAVLTYIRSSWGNRASPVTGDDVKKVRAQLGAAPLPLTREQLLKLPE